jgi:hypothetical protein
MSLIECKHSSSPPNFDMLWALKLQVVGVTCFDLNIRLASRRVVYRCGVARYVRCGLLTKWVALACVCSFFQYAVGSDLFVSLEALSP